MLLSNAPRILAKLKGMDTPEQEGELIQQQMAMNNLMLACSACGLSSSNFSVDDMDDDNDEDEGISSSSLEALLRASLVEEESLNMLVVVFPRLSHQEI